LLLPFFFFLFFSIFKYVLSSFSPSSEAYDRLAELTDSYGSRLTGSQALEDAIDWVVAKMTSDGSFDSVITESVQAAHWVRGNEYANLLTPRAHNLTLLGLGMSQGTNSRPLTAPVIVVKDFVELESRAAEVKGKIVVYNAAYVSYSETGVYRRVGAQQAEKFGAVASLVRSIGPFSLSTPHTGNMEPANIPAAAITIEDAELLQRFQDRGESLVITLYMEAHFLPDTISRNIVADYRGSVYPEKVIVIGGHIDSWDAGTGALDDGGGLMVAWEAVRLMAKYNIRPLRTIRVVMWTNEENGAKGSDVYYANRKNDMNNHIFAIESDGGVFSAYGIGFSGVNAAFDILTDIGQIYLSSISAGNVTSGGGGRDIDPLCAVSVPCAGLNDVDGGRPDKTDIYFNFHHTAADTMSAIRRDEIDSNVAGMGVWALAVADLVADLPRGAYLYVPEKD